MEVVAAMKFRILLLTALALLVFMAGCAARRSNVCPPTGTKNTVPKHSPAMPGSDADHPALTPLGKGLCRMRVLKVFRSYGWTNCKNAPAKP